MSRTFLREVPIEKFTAKEEEYYRKQGYEIVITDKNTVEIWAPEDAA